MGVFGTEEGVCSWSQSVIIIYRSVGSNFLVGGVRTKGTKLRQLNANISPDGSSLKPQAFTGYHGTCKNNIKNILLYCHTRFQFYQSHSMIAIGLKSSSP